MTEREKRYTPGPWEEVDYDDFEEAPVVGVRIRDVLGGYRAVAVIHDQDDQTEANAHLIAAAPELLEMLEKIALQIRRGQDISEWYSEIVDTIEKAHEEAP